MCTLAFSASAPLYAHSGHEDEPSNAQELESFLRSVLELRRQIKTLPPNDSETITLYGRDGKVSYSADHFALAVSHALDLIEPPLKTADAHCGHHCKASKETETSFLHKKWNTLWAKAKRFGWEVGPDTWELLKHHGIPYAVYFAVTEVLEHTVAAPVLGGFPICKLLQGAYVVVADPIRDFAQICQTQLDVPQPVSARLARALTAWRFKRAIQNTLKTALLTPDVPFALAKKQMLAQWKRDAYAATEIERALVDTVYWGEIPARQLETAHALHLKSDALSPARTLDEDIALVANTQAPVSARMDRALQIQNGLKTYRTWIGQLLSASFFERKTLTYRQYWRAKGLLGEVSSSLDRYGALLSSLALSTQTGPRRTALLEELTFSGEEFIRFYEDALELITPLPGTHRPQIESQLRGLSDLLERRLKILSRGELPQSIDCSQLLSR